MKRYFITGTDTDCGKTYVTRQLLKIMPKSLAVKPVASGCLPTDTHSDAKLLQQSNPMHLPLEAINPWHFPLAASPHIAAAQAGCTLSIEAIADFCLSQQWPGIETLLIEGAGGLEVPLNASETWVDFLQLTQIPVILVVGMKLGCINHALLTQTALKANNLACAGWIANTGAEPMQFLEENISTLQQKLAAPLLQTL